MTFPARPLAVLALVAGIAFGASHGLQRPVQCDAAEGAVAVTAIVRAPHPPPLSLFAVAEGYTIAINWINPALPYDGTSIEWFTRDVRFGTGQNLTWHQYQMHYPPATWAHVSAPMGARYTIQASAYYGGGTSISVPSTTSVVMTAPVGITSWCPTSGYAAGASLRERYGADAYAVRLESQLQVPGGAQNLSMDSNPVSWSPQLTDPPHVEIYRQRTRTVHRRGLAPLRIRFWELVSTQRGSFADGYPALCEFRFDSTMPGMYKLVFRGEFAEGFTHGGARDWKSTRYLALAATRFTPKVATPRIKSRLKRGKRATITGSLTLNRRAFVDLTVQRLTHRGWHAYKSVRVRSGIKGTWVARTSVKRTGRYRIRAAVAGRVVSRVCEFAPARSHWRRFSVR